MRKQYGVHYKYNRAKQTVGSKLFVQTPRSAATTTRKLTLQAKLNKLLLCFRHCQLTTTQQSETPFLRRQDWATRRRKQHEPKRSNHNKKGPASPI